MPQLAYSVTFCEQTAAVRRMSARAADVFAAASMTAAAPEPMKHLLLCSQVHSPMSYAFKFLCRQHQAEQSCPLFSQEGRTQSTHLPPELDLAASAICAR